MTTLLIDESKNQVKLLLNKIIPKNNNENNEFLCCNISTLFWGYFEI